ncbi:hypothetical protein Agabi119p4_6140 [Agaricus bisporus var. burnettii]|uniref:Uncharacterized protein n=1 Tax=Agaricus bisporus var. burnettii TaxID=192524 RepID=A0A8H7F189_AGABI|nr:hypothetical protein Agabi119p4_6140 [Agaricus bisporus var. burnettii]
MTHISLKGCLNSLNNSTTGIGYCAPFKLSILKQSVRPDNGGLRFLRVGSELRVSDNVGNRSPIPGLKTIYTGDESRKFQSVLAQDGAGCRLMQAVHIETVKNRSKIPAREKRTTNRWQPDLNAHIINLVLPKSRQPD